MKRLIATFVSFGMLNIYSASAMDINFTNLNLSYDGATGALSSQSLSYRGDSISILLDQENFDMQKEEGRISLLKDGIKASVNAEAGGMLDSIELLELKNAEGAFNPGQTLAIKTDHVAFHLGAGVQSFDRLVLSCQKFQSLKSENLNWIVPCQDQGYFSIPELSIDKKSVATVSKALGIQKGIDKLKDVQLVISNKRFILGFEAKYLFNWKVKATGNLEISSEENVVRLTIVSAKAGIFNIKSKLLKELAESNIKNIKVNGDVITISL